MLSWCAVLSDSVYNVTIVRAQRTLTPQKLASTGLDLVCGKCPHQRSANHSTCTKSRQTSVLCDPYVFTFFLRDKGRKGGKEKRKEKRNGKEGKRKEVDERRKRRERGEQRREEEGVEEGGEGNETSLNHKT